MTNLIADQADIAETNDPDEEVSQLEATRIPVNEGMEFHVQMKGYTLVDFDKMVIEAAARMLLGRSNDSLLAKEIQNKCIELTSAKVASKLESVTSDIINQPLLPVNSYTKQSEPPVTMRDYIGLCGREFLQQRVTESGAPFKQEDSYRRNNSDVLTMIQFLVKKHLDGVFRKEIEKATQDAVREIKAALLSEQKRILDAEKERVQKALSEALGK